MLCPECKKNKVNPYEYMCKPCFLADGKVKKEFKLPDLAGITKAFQELAKAGKWLTNTGKDRESYYTKLGKVIGPPHETPQFTTEQLIDMNIIGIYEPINTYVPVV